MNAGGKISGEKEFDHHVRMMNSRLERSSPTSQPSTPPKFQPRFHDATFVWQESPMIAHYDAVRFGVDRYFLNVRM